MSHNFVAWLEWSRGLVDTTVLEAAEVNGLAREHPSSVAAAGS